MHPKLRAFLEKNGLRAEATEAEAWEFHKQLQSGGVSYVGPERAEPEPQPQPANIPQPAPAPGRDNGLTNEDIHRALAEDRQRSAEIEDVCSHVGMAAQAIRQLVTSGASVDDARKAALEYLRKQNVPFGPGAASGAQVGIEAPEKFRAAALDGLLLRCGRAPEKPADGAREFRGMRLLDICREALELSGVRTRGMDPRAIASRALTAASTSDFANLLGALVNKTLLGAYNEAPATWRVLVTRSDASDFKTKHAIKLSGAPDLAAKNENGEFQTAEFSDSKESYGISTRGRIIRLTREMIINDDLGGFNRIATAFGYAARRWENATVYGLITANGNMSDGEALFSAAHKNLLTGAALSADSLGVGRATMRRQTGMNGEALDVQPAYILTAPELETTSEILLRSAALPTADYSAGVFNPWSGKLTPVSDPLITDTNAWYLFADPNQYPVLEVAWLMGEEQPYIEEEPIFAADAVGILVRHDFGAGAVDHIGAAYNEGA